MVTKQQTEFKPDECIFTVKPNNCTVCMDAHKLQCLIDHNRWIEDKTMMLSDNGKAQLQWILAKRLAV
jgi:hypothetical protein